MRTRDQVLLVLLTLFAVLTAARPTIADQQAEIDVKIATIKSKYGVQIHRVYSVEDYFPERWRKAPISARGGQLALDEVGRLLPIIDQFLSRYPKTVLSDNLANIYLLAELRFYGKSYGATNSRSGLYIKTQAKAKGYTNSFLLQRMHSEFSSILMRNHEFPEEEWRMANAAGFEYRGSGQQMLGETNLYGQSSNLLSQGFIVKYAQSSVENDFNMIAYRLFTEQDELQQLARRYPRIKTKVGLAINFYASIDGRFDFR